MTAPISPATAATVRPQPAGIRRDPRRFGTAGGEQAGGGALPGWFSGELLVPLGVLGIIMALVTPLPTFLLDLLLTADLLLSTIVLMVSMYIRRPVEFSVFPTTLLLMTLFRLALNVSSSRLILLEGSRGTAAAGKVIEAFGNFVVGGNPVVGFVIFLVLIAIQYVVINHGAVRISEVTARFTLDALPGKQMSIDADLNAGLINESEAKARRKSLAAEAEFYGAMDGATRFTQRDAVASLLITAINIVAGFLIGVLQHGMELGRALETYTVLTIGDGLVTVIPALMISIAGGLIVTRAGSDMQMGMDFERQVFGSPQPLLLAAGVLCVMAAVPGLPKLPFILMAGVTGAAGWRLRMKRRRSEQAPVAAAPEMQRDTIETLLRVELLSLEVGLGLVAFVEGGAQAPLLRRIATLRRQLASDLGYLMPSVRIIDNLGLRAREYAVLLKGMEVARYELPAGCDLVLAGDGPAPAGAAATREPAFGLPAWWLATAAADEARRAGRTVVDPLSVLATHLAEIVRRHAHEMFTRQDTKRLLDRVADENPRVVEDLVPKLLPLGTVQRVLQNLLRERISIRDGVTVLEALSEAAALTRNPILMTEFVRQALRRTVVKPYQDPTGALPAYLIDPEVEQKLEQAVEHGETNSQFHWSPAEVRDLVARFERAVGEVQGHTVVLAPSTVRYFLRQVLEGTHPHLVVLSHAEIPGGLKVRSLGVIR